MKIRKIVFNNRRRGFEIRAGRRTLWYPYARLHPRPTAGDVVSGADIDPEMGNEGFTYRLRSGRESAVHLDQVLEYNQDPAHMRDLLLYKLTLEAQKRLAASRLSRREIIRRLGTSATQFYRLVDQTNYRKSIDQMLVLLQVLDCEVDLVVRARTA